MTKSPLDILQEYWGYPDFKGSQEAIIDAILKDQDVLALLPTGGGKSLCYQIPALVKEGICIVVSPLVALIKDQVQRLKRQNIKAIALVGGLPFQEVDVLLDNCVHGNYKFLFLSPERLQQPLVQERIRQMRVNLVAIDEAHCISQWGNDFRPAYRHCNLLRELHPHVPFLALTATATERVANDIVENLRLRDCEHFRDSFLRKNIAYKVIEDEDKRSRLKELCEASQDSCIVYVRTRRLTQELATYLNKMKVPATFFHGGLTREDKEAKLNGWMANDTKVMVATNAFGMGIDKSDVSCVIHYQLPDSLENYFQEAGRAGRNGAPAQAITILSKADEGTLKEQFLSAIPSVLHIKKVYHKLNSYFQIPYAGGQNETFRLNFNEFCETYQLNAASTYNVLKILDQYSVISLSQSFSKQTSLRFTASKNELWGYLEANPAMQPVVQHIVRTYGGTFDFETKINTLLLSKKTGLTETKILEALLQLKKQQLIELHIQDRDLEIIFLVPREDERTINVFGDQVKKQQQLKVRNIDLVLQFVNNDTRCRSRQLLSYFGEDLKNNCGTCDVCIRKKGVSKSDWRTAQQDILVALKAKNRSSRELIGSLNYPDDLVLTALREMLEDGRISIGPQNEYTVM